MLQTRVLGWRHGPWGKKAYPGVLPVKTDLLDWHVKHITELRGQILEEQEKCKKRPGPTAFVTFKSALIPLFLALFNLLVLLIHAKVYWEVTS